MGEGGVCGKVINTLAVSQQVNAKTLHAQVGLGSVCLVASLWETVNTGMGLGSAHLKPACGKH